MKKFIQILPEICIIGVAVLLRLLPHPANIAPIGALALFGGAYLDKKQAFIFPILALFLSDIFLGFHSTMVFVYASFLLTGGIGYLVRNHKTVFSLGAASLLASTLFFFIINTGVWLTTPSSVYAKTWNGLMTCLVSGIPFFRNTLIGDLLYLGAFSVSYMFLKRLSALYYPYANLYKTR
jgi:hypothetical protein